MTCPKKQGRIQGIKLWCEVTFDLTKKVKGEVMFFLQISKGQLQKTRVHDKCLGDEAETSGTLNCSCAGKWLFIDHSRDASAFYSL